jgi:hypothetical protein
MTPWERSTILRTGAANLAFVPPISARIEFLLVA